MSQEAESWFALQVRTRWERSTKTLLSGKGYEVLLPTYKPRHRWSGRGTDGVAPLFPGYLFCRFDLSKRLPVLITPGVISVVGRGRVGVPLEESEISAIQSVVASGASAEPWSYLEVGERVRIEDPVMFGVEGILVRFKGTNRVVVSVSLLRRSVAVEIDRFSVSPIRSMKDAVSDSFSRQSLLGRVTA